MKIVRKIWVLIAFCIVSSALHSQSRHFNMQDYYLRNFTSGTKKVKSIKLTTGVQLQYAEKGSALGIPVIFLHAFTDSWHSFDMVLPELPEMIHAFAISQRGHGDSERPASGYTTADFSKDVVAFIQQLKLGPVIVVGHSMGGLIAQQLAVDHPELVKALVIVSSDAAIGDNPGMPEFAEVIKGLPEKIDREFVDQFQKSTCAQPVDSMFYQLLVDESMKIPARVWKAVMAGLMSADFRKALPKFNMPALIVWGAKDTLFLESDQQTLTTGIPDATFLKYEAAGHALHWEEPARFAADLISFVDTITKTR